MMKKYFLSVFQYTLWTLVAFFVLSTPAHAAEEKPVIGVIDWREAVFSSKTAQKENADLKRQHKADTDKIKSLEGRIRSNNERLEKEGESMSAKKKEKILKQLQADVLEYQKLGERLQTVLKRTEQEFIQRQSIKMTEAFKRITEEKGLHVILAKDAVVYSRLSIDVTQDVIKYLDK